MNELLGPGYESTYSLFTFLRCATIGGAKFRVFCGGIEFSRGLANYKNGGVNLLRGQFFPKRALK